MPPGLVVLLLALAPDPVGLPAPAVESPTPVSTPSLEPHSGDRAGEAPATPVPTPRPPGLGVPVLFRGECTPGGGASGCRIVAAGLVVGDAIQPLSCDSAEQGESRKKIADRYFAPGHVLDLYVRGAPSGSFVVAAQDEPPRGCSNRARGKKVGSVGRVTSFVALDPEDPVKLSALRFPAGVQADAREVARGALQAEPFNAPPAEVGIHEVRRFREGDRSVLVVEATTGRGRVILIAEGEGRDPAGWKVVWSSEPDAQMTLVDIFDLGADQKTEIFLERLHRGEPSEWVLLRRGERGWAPVLR